MSTTSTNALHSASATTKGGSFLTDVEAAGHAFISDASKPHGGGTAASPMDLLTAALAACTTMTVQSYAARKEWPLETVSASVEHLAKSGDEPERFEMQLDIQGQLDADQRASLESIAHKCPVHKVIAGSVPVRVHLQ